MKSIFATLLLLLTTEIQAQMFWQRPVVNYERHAYNAANQNWMITQHKNGWMYFANNKGLLEFDGIYWNLYPLPHSTKMRCVKIGNDNHIYVGGLKEFGFFTANNRGRLEYHSLSEKLAPSKVSNIWNIHILNNKVYYQGDRFIYCYDHRNIAKIDCNGAAYSCVANNRIYFSNVFGLSYIKGQRTVHIPQSEFLNKNIVTAILPYQGKLIIVTTEQGIYLYDGHTFSKPFTQIDDLLKGHRASCASLNHNTLALGTADAGIFLINLKNLQIENISTDNGLQNKSILSMKFDKDNNLWLGLDNGIDYISLNSNLFFLNSKLSSIGAGYCSQYYQGKLYLGTNQGVQETNIPSSINIPTHLKKLTRLSGLVHCMYQYDGKLFCGGRNFFAMIDGTQIHSFDKRGVWHVQAVGQDADIILFGTYWGLEVMRKQNGKWNITNKVEGMKTSAKSMYIEPESGNVWIANKNDGLWRITLDRKFTKVLHKKNYNSQLLPKGDNIYITKIHNDIIFATRQGLFKYNDNKDALYPATDLEKKLDGHCAYTYIKQEPDGRIWYVANSILKCMDYKKGTKSSYWKDFMMEDFEDVYALNNDQTIVGTEDGFALISRMRKSYAQQDLKLQIRKLYTTLIKDSIIYEKSIDNQEDDIRIDYRYNSIRLEYGCNNYNHTQVISYSYKLKGYNDQWSEYTTATSKEYTNLPEGTYTFELKMRPDSGNKAIQTSLTFTILPPWYRSWWAYTLYIIAILYAIYDIYHRYKKGRERLIQLKDAEMNRQKNMLERDINQKEEQINKLEEEKLRTELNYKSDELVKTTLNVVRKNEILQRIKKDAENLSRTINEGNLVSIRRGMLRLITQIDTNIEHDSDLDNFQSSFDAVHNDFFKKLGRRFPLLTSKDKMLCAYIKMNLMSKEIAPLLNISVRGVEISRYRLRKKLGLDEKDNLAEFLQKLE